MRRPSCKESGLQRREDRGREGDCEPSVASADEVFETCRSRASFSLGRPVSRVSSRMISCSETSDLATVEQEENH